MVQDIDIKSKRILLFDFDGTLIETASGNTFATDLTDMRIKKDRNGLCDGREGVPITNLPPPETRFLPRPPFAGKPETRFYLKPTNYLIINILFNYL